MYNALKLVLLIVIFVYVKAQYRRNKIYNSYPNSVDDKDLYSWTEKIPCAISACMKRSAGQDELGPFWANRGKRHPNYLGEPFYVEEPYWVWVRRDDTFKELSDPFFTSRGKKDEEDAEPYRNINLKFRDRREFPQVVESPFFAARGKKSKPKNDKF